MACLFFALIGHLALGAESAASCNRGLGGHCGDEVLYLLQHRVEWSRGGPRPGPGPSPALARRGLAAKGLLQQPQPPWPGQAAPPALAWPPRVLPRERPRVALPPALPPSAVSRHPALELVPLDLLASSARVFRLTQELESFESGRLESNALYVPPLEPLVATTPPRVAKSWQKAAQESESASRPRRRSRREVKRDALLQSGAFQRLSPPPPPALGAVQQLLSAQPWPEESGRGHASVQPPRAWRTDLPLVNFAQSVVQQQCGSRAAKNVSASANLTAGTERDSAEVPAHYVLGWLSGLLALTFLLGGAVLLYARKMPVDIEEDPDPAVSRASGKFYLNYICALLSIFLVLFVFAVAICSIIAVNKDIEEQPSVTVTVGGEKEQVLRFTIGDYGRRAFEAGAGVAFSLGISGLTLVAWRQHGGVKITSALLSSFLLRGATLSLFVAVVLEILGSMLLGKIGFHGAEGLNITTFLTMAIVGFSEELGKLLAVTCGACLARGKLLEGSRSGCCVGSYVLLDTPRKLALAGLAAGFGFMTLENAGYVTAAATTPPTMVSPAGSTVTASPTQEDMMVGTSISVMTCVTILVRVLLNIHPWLTGLSAARLAHVFYDEELQIGCSDLLRAIIPSAVIHAAFDFGLVTLPGICSLIFVPFCWFLSRWLLIAENREARAGPADPAVPAGPTGLGGPAGPAGLAGPAGADGPGAGEEH